MSDMTLSDVPQPGPWRVQARCRTAPSSLFFPTRGDNLAQARALCAGCAVADDCRTYVLSHPGLRGIWAGLSEKERESL